MPYKTLVIAPKTNLLLAEDEVQQVANALSAKQLPQSQANIHGLLEILREDFDIIWFCTHGDEKGVYLNDGILSTSEITTLVRSSSARLVVLNTCSSRPVALSIYDELRIPLVCTLFAIPDRSAFIFGTLFARKIALGMPFREAFDRARPGQDKTYVFLPETELIPTMPPMERDRDRQDVSSADILRMINSVNRLEILVSGNRDYGVDGLVPTVRMLSEKIDHISEQMEELRHSHEFQRRLLYTVTVICFALFVSTLLLVYQRGA